MNNKSIIKMFIGLLFTVLITFTANDFILQGGKKVSLQSAPELAGPISQNLGLSSSNNVLPIYNKDYKINKSRYFLNRDWVVIEVSTTNDSNEVYMVMQKVNGVYQVVIKPGTIFSSSYVYTLPVEVSQYLSDIGVLNG